jgi:hypothetical protein
MSPLRDPLGLDGSPKPVGGSRQLLLRRLLPGFDLWWNWRQSKRAASCSASADPEHEDRGQGREPDQK